MHRLVPPFILDRYVAGEADGEFEAASLFVDVSGFSAMTSALMTRGQHGAEVLATVMRAIFDPLVAAVYAHEGFITGFAGDAFTAVFPVSSVFGGELEELRGTHSPSSPPSPSSSPSSPLGVRALAAAWTIRQHMREHTRYETVYGAFDVGVKIGLAAGSVQWGIIRLADDTRAAFYFRGPAIDGCAAADRHTGSGELVLHPSTMPLLHDAVTAVALPDGYARLAGVNVALPAPLPVTLPPVDRAALARFLPPEVIDQTQTGEFRQAINVFVNLHDDPSDQQIHEFMAAAFDLQVKYGGLFNRIDFGDKGCSLLLFWGAPVSHENDVARALNFLLELRDQTRIPIRAGVTSSILHAGFIGSNLHGEYTCYGKGVNLAARLMTSAPWGGIWLDAEMQRRATAQFTTDYAGEKAFKGFAEPQAVYSLVDRRREIEFGYDGAMVGREAELQVLAAFATPILAGRFAGVLVVQGEAGMGKSRLVHEFLQQALRASENAQQLRILIAQTDSILRYPFNPFRYWLRSYFARNPLASEVENKRAFDAVFDALVAAMSDAPLQRELIRVRSVLGALVDLYWDGSLYARLDPRGRYDNTLDAITTLLLGESLRQPVVLVLEDVHWLDEDSVQAIRRLVRNVNAGQPRAYPLAVLAAARPDTAPLFGGEIDHQTLHLAAFSRAELTTLATGVLDGPPAPELVDLLLARTDGNPFFAEQVLCFLRDEGKLALVDDRWTVNRAALDAAPLPADVSVIFVARLDRLGQAVKEVVQTAAVLGREFEVTVLSGMLRHGSVFPAITAAETEGIWSALNEIRYLFRHVLLRDAAYEMQIQARRASLHQLAAWSLETVWAGDLAPHYGEISYHYESAFRFGVRAVRQQAVDYLTRAGAHAAKTFANAAAADFFTRALALTPDEDAVGRFQLLLERESIYDFQGDRDAQAQDVSALEELARQLGQPAFQAEAAMRRAYQTGDTADFAGALAASYQALALAREAGLPALEATAHRTAGAALRVQGKFSEALDHFEQAIAVAQAANLAYQEATAWTAWSSLNVRRGNWTAAAAALERVVTIFEQLGRMFRVAMALNELGIALTAAGRLSEAQARFEQAIALTREIGDRPGQIPPLYNLPLALIAQGAYRRADASASEAIEIAREVQNQYMQTRGKMARGRAAMHSGDLKAAQRLLEEVWQAAQSDYPDLRGWILTHRAAVALLAGLTAAAYPLAAEAVELARAVDDRNDLALSLVYLSLAQEGLGQFDAAEAGFRECVDLELQMGMVMGRGWDGRAGLARVRLAQGRLDEALAEMEPIAARLATEWLAGERGHGLSQCEQPLRVYLSCYRVLSAAGDPRSAQILERGVAVLSTLAEQFDEPASRQRFLAAIPFHRETLAAWQAVQTGEVQ